MNVESAVGRYAPGTPRSIRADVVVVGSGIAGLYAALLAAPHGKVVLVTKGALEESNTRYAQGGIAVALGSDDSPELHLRDTIAAGDGLCDREQVARLTSEAPSCILDLLRRGVPFDRDNGELAWTREAAHTVPRVLHAGGDATGASVEKTLAAAVRSAGVSVREHALCASLLTDGGRVRGVELLPQSVHEVGTRLEIHASQVILATGGAGQLFARTTNPAVATGDGLAIAYRAGAELMDLEFMQFHPTALAVDGAPSFLISEAVRGEGGILRDGQSRAFMADYHPDRELAPRDVVARAIHGEMMRTDSRQMWLDITHLPVELIEHRFPTIVHFCRRWGIDPVRDMIPVAPAAHYLMGGVRADGWGRTSVPGLFACGEVACTGVHGANRLASNSLLEGLVFARRAVRHIVEGDDVAHGVVERSAAEQLAPPISEILERAPSRADLAETLWRHASLVRSAESLRAARETIAPQPERSMDARDQGRAERGAVPRDAGASAHEEANLALLGRLLLESARLREESRGAHFRSDFPRRDPAWLGHIVVSARGVWYAPLSSTVAAVAQEA